MNGEDMTGQRPSGVVMKFWGEEHYCRRGLYFLLDIFLVLEFGWIVTGVHQVAGSFGLGG